MIDLTELKLGLSDQQIRLETAEDNRTAALALARQATRSLDIYSHHLDKLIYDHEPFVEAVKRLALYSSHTLIRVLVVDSSHAAKNGHRLVNLGHRLSSKIQFRQPNAEYHNDYRVFLVADGLGIIQRNLGDRYEGKLNFHSPNEARSLLTHFNEVWINSVPDPYLRRLTI